MASAYARPQSFDNFDIVNLLKDNPATADAVVQTLDEETQDVYYDVSTLLIGSNTEKSTLFMSDVLCVLNWLLFSIQ